MLTESKVKALKPKEKEYIISDDTRERGTGRLILRIRPHGAKEWQYRYREGGKRKKVTLGTHPNMPLSKAREEAAKAASGIAGFTVQGKGKNALKSPTAAPPATIQAALDETPYGTLGELCHAYTENMRELGRRTADETYRRLQRYVQKPYPHLWSKPAREVQVRELTKLLSDYIQRGITTTTNRLRAYLHAAYQYGLTSENDPRRISTTKWGLVANPVSAIAKQSDWERQGETVMSAQDVRRAWEELPKMRQRTANAVPVVLLCLATAGQRPTSLLRLQVQNVHIQRRILDMPASGTKNGRPHVVPLSDRAIRILEPLMERSKARGWDFLFPNHRGSEKHMLLESPSSLVTDYRKQFQANQWTIRDIRRTAKTVLGELGVPKHTRDLLHGHVMNDVSSRHYDRYDYLKEKREAIKIWDDWLEGVINGHDSRSKAQ
ncbi:tyrosine-type recombinase/integrase [Kushneria sp. TE3]|uniref:tyrosine-type recombinase/integrase n=1 Tax=Kushneria sp. TE3 TaxID=3449832 RepID=UPI003F6884FC